MAKKKVAPQKYAGGLATGSRRGPNQKEAEDGRQEANRAHKTAFRSGQQDARDTDGVVTQGPGAGLMRSPLAQAESKRAAVTRLGRKRP